MVAVSAASTHDHIDTQGSRDGKIGSCVSSDSFDPIARVQRGRWHLPAPALRTCTLTGHSATSIVTCSHIAICDCCGGPSTASWWCSRRQQHAVLQLRPICLELLQCCLPLRSLRSSLRTAPLSSLAHGVFRRRCFDAVHFLLPRRVLERAARTVLQPQVQHK